MIDLLGKLRQRLRRRWLAIVVSLALLGQIGFGVYLAGGYLWANYHFREAQRAFAQGDLPRARANLQLCLQVWPPRGQFHYLAARTERRAGDFDSAEAHLRECERLQGRTDALELEWALLGAQRGGLARVEGYLLACVQQDHPDALLILEVLTRAYAETYRLARALHCLDLWLRRQPESVRALYWRGLILERLLLRSPAMDCYHRVLTLDPEQDGARLHLADSLLQIDETREALKHLQWLAERQPTNVAVQLSLARCRSDLGQPEKARQLLDGLLTAHPENGLALIERGKVSLRMNQLREAEKWLRKAIAVAPHERMAHELLSQCLEARGKKDEAQHYRAAAERIGADGKRIEELNKQIAEAPGDAAARCELGTILLHSGREQEGLAWLTSALQEDPQYRPAQKALANYYQHASSGEVPKASSAVMSLP